MLLIWPQSIVVMELFVCIKDVSAKPRSQKCATGNVAGGTSCRDLPFKGLRTRSGRAFSTEYFSHHQMSQSLSTLWPQHRVHL